ncbi:MAG: MucR family transcriptional regulator [Brevundimonas sp.]|uniref:MucR family transcriptional regulator n=1 Tax=Brevundimonas sp. TaxID=1871086 RepID=UPI000DB25251|nr:MucR family transcriptional regulator [Brevundimonas sp.]PZT98774.1 MAG: MucR family transcriptional regulator [Brevundimonas sp.]
MSDDTYSVASDARDGTIELVSAYVSNTNTHLTAEQFQALIRETFATLSSLDVSTTEAEPETATPDRKSRAEIRKSIGHTALISFEDGKPYKSLKRHLGTRGLTPDDYRAKWGLPSDYPMVHPAYSAQRSELARAIGLGSKGRQAKAVAKPAPKTRKLRQPKA